MLEMCLCVGQHSAVHELNKEYEKLLEVFLHIMLLLLPIGVQDSNLPIRSWCCEQDKLPTMGKHDRKDTSAVKDEIEGRQHHHQQQAAPQVQYVFLPKKWSIPSFQADDSDELEAEEWAAKIRCYVTAKGIGDADGAVFAISLLEREARQ